MTIKIGKLTAKKVNKFVAFTVVKPSKQNFTAIKVGKVSKSW